MVIELKFDIFENPNNLRDVSYLIGIFSNQRRYNFFCDIVSIKNTEVYRNLMTIDKEIIEEYFNRCISESIKPDHLIETASTGVSFNIEEAKRYFNQPLTIILENSLNDSYFINAIIDNFKNKGRLIKRHLQNGWLNYGNGGGLGNIKNTITSIMNGFVDLPKGKHKYLKCFVLVDSDKEYPTANSKPDRQELYEFLRQVEVPYHELEKREMENYLPDEVIETIDNDKAFINSYLNLNNLQKDYFDFERGFTKNLASYDQQIQELYNDVTPEDFGNLRHRKIDLNGNFKAEFPKLFSHSKVVQASLKSRVSHQTNDPNELETILDKISKLL